MKVQIQDLNKQNIGQIIVCADLGVFGTLAAVQAPTTDGEFPNYTVTIGGTEWEMQGDEYVEVFRDAVLGLMHRQHMEFLQRQQRALYDGDFAAIEELIQQRVNAATATAVSTLQASMDECMRRFEESELIEQSGNVARIGAPQDPVVRFNEDEGDAMERTA